MVEIIKTEIQGARELDKLLGQLPKKMGFTALRGAVRAGAKIIMEDAKARVSVDTGDLRDSIRIQKVRARGTSVTFVVGAEKKEFYGQFIEFGTSKQSARPWLRPAFDTRVKEALDKIGDELGKRVERTAKKLAGGFRKSGLGAKKRRRR